jgi:hypothetical protein
MVQIAFVLVAGVPIFLFLRKVRALRLTRGYALILTVLIVVGLWILVQVTVGLGRIF